jgi:indolepyruvate ferredoxin oxidoreductase beta subunit
MNNMSKEINIIVTGVGGQGNVLIADIIAEAASIEGYEVCGSEIFGASQRGGPVVSHIRLGAGVFSPLIPTSKAQILLCLEPSEGLRAAVHYIAPGALAILNTQVVPSITVNLAIETYPELIEIIKFIEKLDGSVLTINASEIAESLGNQRAMNMVMLGALAGSRKLPIKVDTFEKVISERFSGLMRDLNMQAFRLGHGVVSMQIKA